MCDRDRIDSAVIKRWHFAESNPVEALVFLDEGDEVDVVWYKSVVSKELTASTFTANNILPDDGVSGFSKTLTISAKLHGVSSRETIIFPVLNQCTIKS
jgi:hypothetical protein